MRHKKFSSIGKILDPKKLYKTQRHIKEIIVHCSDSPQGRGDTAFDIDRWHKYRWNSGIGYHLVILEDGTLQKGRWMDYIGAHAYDGGHNIGSIGIVFIGGKEFNDITEQQKATLITTLKTLKKDYDLEIDNILGHSEVSTHGKTCPMTDMDKIRKGVNDGK